LERYGRIFGAMPNPNRQRLQFLRVSCFSRAANGHHGGKAIRMIRGQAPGAVTPHAQACQINPVFIGLARAADVVEQRQQQCLLVGLGP
jgi:hypothetical protein